MPISLLYANHKTMRRTFITLAIILSLACISVAFLYYSQPRKSSVNTSFERIFNKIIISNRNEKNTEYANYYIAGITQDEIYLGNHKAPLHVLRSVYSLRDTSYVKIHFPNGDTVRSLRFTVQAPYFFLTDGLTGKIFRGKLDNWASKAIIEDGNYFKGIAPVDSASFILKVQSSRTHQDILMKTGGSVDKLAEQLLEKQIDGRFCVDGMMHYNWEAKRFVYVYYYRNSFICTDADLNLIYRHNTIDTTSRARIKVSEITSNNTVTLSTPPYVVNRKSCISSDRVFINSSVRGKGEDESLFSESSVIDVYDLASGNYQSSFYIPARNGGKIRDFEVHRDMLVTLYDKLIVVYKIQYPPNS